MVEMVSFMYYIREEGSHESPQWQEEKQNLLAVGSNVCLLTKKQSVGLVASFSHPDKLKN